MTFELDEVRRLTGPNLLSDEPGAIADVLFSNVASDAVLKAWRIQLTRVFSAINWQYSQTSFYRFYGGGMSLSIQAPMDLLYSACDIVELAWDLCVEEFKESTADVKHNEQTHKVDFSHRIDALNISINEEKHPELIALMHEAAKNDVLCLADDDEISFGSGSTSRTFPVSDLPDPKNIDWDSFAEIPLALITGTNGKSTSVRLAAAIAKAANVNAGVTSTDFIKVGDTIIDEGDYSGPGGARMLLRDQRSQMAFLEVARGGLLRRGLPVKQAQAALVTNVASDHLGQYGINTVDDIADVKIMVSKAIAPVREGAMVSGSVFDSQKQADKSRTQVLNADDKRLVEQAKKLDMRICWFSQNEHNPMIFMALLEHTPCVFTRNGELIYSDQKQVCLGRIHDIPMTMNGTARHNIENALGVVGLCKALNIDDNAIRAGLLNFVSSAKDNPGRGNMYEVNGAKVVIDFAHNPHSMRAVIDMAANMPAKNKHVLFSHAGDRSDEDIKEVSDAVQALSPSTYVLAEIERYLRGRELGEVSEIVKKHLIESGVETEKIILANDPLEGTKKLMPFVQAGDLVILLVLNDRENVQDFLLSYS